MPETEVVAAPSRMSAPEMPTAIRSASTRMPGSSPSNAAAMPTSGASSHSSPSAVSPPVTGYADRPMAAISTVTSTTSPIAEKSERGSVRPGSRASSARFAAVSRPVYASIASGSAKARSPHSWPLAKPKPSRSVSGREEERGTEQHEHRLDDQVEDRDRERARVQARVAEEAHAGDRRDDEAPDQRVPRRLPERLRRRARRRGSAAGRARTAPSRSGSRGRAPSRSRSRRGR